jgi:predicted permease
MRAFGHVVALTAPLFLLVLLGYALTRGAVSPKDASDALTRLCFQSRCRHIGVPLALAPCSRPFSRQRIPPHLIMRQVLGMGLAKYRISDRWRVSVAICVLKLLVRPVIVYVIARPLSLPPTETQAIVMLASLPVGANVYLMSRQFYTLGGPVAASLVLSTAMAAASTPLVLSLTAVTLR